MTKICIENSMSGVIVDSRGWDCKEDLYPDELAIKVLQNHGILGLRHKSKKVMNKTKNFIYKLCLININILFGKNLLIYFYFRLL